MLITRMYSGNRTFESAYRVHEFRRLLTQGRSGRGLVQFWGDIKKRRQDSDGVWSPWLPPERCDPDGLCTVEIDAVVNVTDPKRR